MISNEKIKILEVWRKNPFEKLSVTEIMQKTKKETKTWIFNSLKILVKANILKSTRKSNLDVYSLNLENPLSFQFLQYLEAQNNLNFIKLNIISEIIEKMPIKNCSIIVFGSYAIDKQTKNSDLDICILVENIESGKKIKPFIEDIKLSHPTNIDEHYIVFEDFTNMLVREEENLAKQIFIKNRLFYNSEIYYQLLKKAYKNGFRP